MSSSASKAGSSLVRYRPAILAFTAIAAGFTIYAISSNFTLFPTSTPDASQPSGGSLHRSNAQRRRLRCRRPIGMELQSESAPELGVIINYGEKYYRNRRVFGRYQYTNPINAENHVVWLAPHQLPSIRCMQEEWNIGQEEASSLRWHMEIKLLDSFFAQEMPPEPPIPLTGRAREGFSIEFAAAAQIPPETVGDAIERYQMGSLQNHPARFTQGMDSEQPRPTRLSISSPDEILSGTPGDLSAVFRIFHDAVIGEARDDEPHLAEAGNLQSGEAGGDEVRNGEHHIAETESVRSDEHRGDDQNKPPDDQNLMNLLYRISENQEKKEGFVHRGVNCNGCNAMPIRGIRFRCSNCPDFDLCEQCDSMQIHDKTHIFERIRIPTPLQSNPKAAPVRYPGNPGKVCQNLTTELKMTLAKKSGIPEKQVYAVWEQFQCLASGDFLDDPYGFRIAIDRGDFNKCFVPCVPKGTPPANLIYDRTFSFYDTNNDGLIGFEELLDGISCIANKGDKLRAKVFQSYDLNGDGFVTRKDFLRMFQAHYALTKELTAQVITGTDDEYFDEDEARETIESSQPISSIFSGPIPSGDPSRTGMGESILSRDGEVHVDDGEGFLLENETADHVPWSDVDVGRDVIYQVTREAMNELLDPMFKLREDLAIEFQKSRKTKQFWKPEIDRYVRDGLEQTIMKSFQYFQKRWYQDSEYADLMKMPLAHHVLAFVGNLLSQSPQFQESFPGTIISMDVATGEVSYASTSTSQAASPTEKSTGDVLLDDPELTLGLQEGILALDGAMSVKGSPKGKPLADADCEVEIPSIQSFDRSSASSISFPDDEDRYLDPTMPQNRLNSLNEAPPKEKTLHQIPRNEFLALVILAVIEKDDKKRGGWGRLDLTDYTHIMEGDKGEGLGFVGSWIETSMVFGVMGRHWEIPLHTTHLSSMALLGDEYASSDEEIPEATTATTVVAAPEVSLDVWSHSVTVINMYAKSLQDPMRLQLMLAKPTDTALTHNVPYADLARPSQGPANPYVATSGNALRRKNALTGDAEETSISDATFNTQHRTWQSRGYAADPSMNGAFVGDLVKAQASGGKDVVQTRPSKEKSAEHRRKRQKRGDASIVDGEGAYMGPWAKYEAEAVYESASGEEELASDEGSVEEAIVPAGSTAVTKLTSDYQDDLANTETTEFNGAAQYDYQGRTYMHVPQDLDIDLRNEPGTQKNYIPKKLIHTWKSHTKAINAVRFFPNSGHLLLSASADSKVKLWDVYHNRELLRTYSGHTKSVTDTTFSPTGTHFLTGSYDRFLKLWDTETGACTSRFQTPSKAVPH
ncbi:MAG: hypothetical protein Q9226_003021, partial [Calogaya cf. arnoldii]